MRILIAFVCMGFVGTVASALAFAQVLARTWPLAVVVVGIIVAVRWHDRRRRAIAPPQALPAPIANTSSRPLQSGQPVAPRPAAWVLVPVWMDPLDRQAPRHRVVDADVIPGDGRHG